MENYSPIKLNPNEVFGFTKPVEKVVITQSSAAQPNWPLIVGGGILLVVLIYLYQNHKINEMNREEYSMKTGKEDL